MTKKELVVPAALMVKLEALYELAEHTQMESFTGIYLKIELLGAAFLKLIMLSIEGDKVSYDELKESIQKDIEHIFEVHDQIVVKSFNLRNKDKH